MIRKFGVIGAALVLCGFSRLAMSAVPAALKIGYVNFDMAFSLEEEAKKYNEELSKKGNDILASEQQAHAEFKTQVDSFPKLAEKERKAREEALTQRYYAKNQEIAQKKMEFHQEKEKTENELREKNLFLLNNIAKLKGYTYVMNSAVLAYISQDAKKDDLTMELVEAYNKAYPVAKAKPKAMTPKK